jgi:hypothetical protein
VNAAASWEYDDCEACGRYDVVAFHPAVQWFVCDSCAEYADLIHALSAAATFEPYGA